jgi:hypothetical protein
MVCIRRSEPDEVHAALGIAGAAAALPPKVIQIFGKLGDQRGG